VAGAELIAANNLSLEFAGQLLNGAAALRLVPAPRFDLSFAAQRLDVAPWLQALRSAGRPALPVALDLAAEAATLGPLRLRRLRGSAFLEGERLTLSDVVAELPGEGRLEASGASAGPRLDLALRWSAAHPALLLESLGWPARLPPPAGPGEGQLRLSSEGVQLAVTDMALRLGESRLSGGFTWRQSPRPSLALSLDGDALTLSLSQADLAGTLAAAGQGADLQLRLGLGRLVLADGSWERLALDGAAEAGRLVLRRLSGRHLGLDIAMAGSQVGGRISDATLEAEGMAGPLLTRLGFARPALEAAPLRLRASLAGPADALALRLETDLAEARLEVQSTLDLPAGRSQGSLTARHPGAVRLLASLLGREAPDFLGDGSFSLVAQLATRREGWTSDSFELVAGAMRARGQLSLTEAARPSLAGRVALETLPLPAPTAGGARLAPFRLRHRPAWPIASSRRTCRMRAGQRPAARRCDGPAAGTGPAPAVGARAAGGHQPRAGRARRPRHRGQPRRCRAERSANGTPADSPRAGFPPPGGSPRGQYRRGAAGKPRRHDAASPCATRAAGTGRARGSGGAQQRPLRGAAAGGPWRRLPRPSRRGTLDPRRAGWAGGGAGAELLAEGGLALRLSGRFDLPRDVLTSASPFP
jgi:hypothetical protein